MEKVRGIMEQHLDKRHADSKVPCRDCNQPVLWRARREHRKKCRSFGTSAEDMFHCPHCMKPILDSHFQRHLEEAHSNLGAGATVRNDVSKLVTSNTASSHSPPTATVPVLDANFLPFVQERCPFRDLASSYQNQELREKIMLLSSDYPSWLPVRGDGNCFYRAMLFGLVMTLTVELLDRWEKALTAACERYREVSSECMGAFRWLRQQQRPSAIDVVLGPHSNALVLGLRAVTAGHIERHEAQWAAFLDSSVTSYCMQHVLVMGEEAEGSDMQAVADALNLSFDTVYLNADGKKSCPRIVISNSDGAILQSMVSLLLRPGHYDVLFVRDMYDSLVVSDEDTTLALTLLTSKRTPVRRLSLSTALSQRGIVVGTQGAIVELNEKNINVERLEAIFVTKCDGTGRLWNVPLACLAEIADKRLGSTSNVAAGREQTDVVGATGQHSSAPRRPPPPAPAQTSVFAAVATTAVPSEAEKSKSEGVSSVPAVDGEKSSDTGGVAATSAEDRRTLSLSDSGDHRATKASSATKPKKKQVGKKTKAGVTASTAEVVTENGVICIGGSVEADGADALSSEKKDDRSPAQGNDSGASKGRNGSASQAKLVGGMRASSGNARAETPHAPSVAEVIFARTQLFQAFEAEEWQQYLDLYKTYFAFSQPPEELKTQMESASSKRLGQLRALDLTDLSSFTVIQRAVNVLSESDAVEAREMLVANRSKKKM